MARLTFVTVLVAALAGAVSAAPIVARNAIVARAFTELPYAQFQISDGVAGDAQAKAEAVCVGQWGYIPHSPREVDMILCVPDPFAGQNLANVDDASLTALKNMRQAAEDAETELFNPTIDAASGAEGRPPPIYRSLGCVLKLPD